MREKDESPVSSGVVSDKTRLSFSYQDHPFRLFLALFQKRSNHFAELVCGDLMKRAPGEQEKRINQRGLLAKFLFLLRSLAGREYLKRKWIYFKNR